MKWFDPPPPATPSGPGLILTDVPDFPPHVRKPQIVFGTTVALPAYDVLPQRYREGTARGNMMAESIFYDGWKTASAVAQCLYADGVAMAAPSVQHIYAPGECRDPVDRFQRCIQAHLQAWGPDRRHLLAGVGYLVDLWFGVLSDDSKGVST